MNTLDLHSGAFPYTKEHILIVINQLELENQRLLNPNADKVLSPHEICDFDRECYYAHMYAISYLKTLKDNLDALQVF
jgi:hypothetical protein